MKKLALILMIVAFAITGCLSKTVIKKNASVKSIAETTIPAEFDFSTKKVVNVNLQGENLAEEILEIYTKNPAKGGKRVASTYFDANGKFEGSVVVTNSTKSLFVKCNGSTSEILLNGNSATASIMSSSSTTKRPLAKPDPVDNYYFVYLFEDKWPYKGDYDLNDAIIEADYSVSYNSRTYYVKKITISYQAIASGANKDSGFALALDIDKTFITKVTNSNPNSNFTNIDSKGLENGNSKPVVVFFNNFKEQFKNTNGDHFINTIKGKNYKSDWYEVTIEFEPNTTIKYEDIRGKINPFIFNTNDRGIEVHKKGAEPTGLFNKSLFNTGDDTSINGNSATYFQTEKGWSWAVELALDSETGFNYPIEKTSVEKAFKKFMEWAQSSGRSCDDWYNTANGKSDYFDLSKMYLGSESQLSSDSTLKNLSLNPGVLTPSFNPNITEYTATVENGITAVNVNAESNSSSANVNITGNSNLLLGDNVLKITVTAENGSMNVYNIKVTVKELLLNSIEIKAPATKLSYFIGESLDITGLTIEGTYSNGTKKLESITANNIKGFDSTTAGTKTLTIDVNGKTTTYLIKVNDIVLNSIALKTSAWKLVYFVGESLDITGLTVEGTYSNGTKKLESITTNNIRGFDTTIAGIKTLTVDVNGKTTTYNITINKVSVKMIASGINHTMILKDDGTLWATGLNGYGQLGDGTTTNRSSPVQVMTDVAYVSCGANHTMILKTNGTLWATGYNNYGQLADGTTANKTMPVQVMYSVSSVSSGAYHTAILKNDGTLWASGYNNYGQLGDGTTSNRASPIQLGTNNVASVSCGGSYTMILKRDGTVWASGFNNYGQLGDGTTSNRATPIQVMTNATSVAASLSSIGAHTMILKYDGTLWASGFNGYGQLGDGTISINRPSFIQVMTYIQTVSSGLYHTTILKKDNTLWACGNNYYGQLGDGSVIDKSSPIQLMTNVTAISSGGYHTTILKNDGTVWSYGKNDFGQLGDGTTINRSTPVKIM